MYEMAKYWWLAVVVVPIRQPTYIYTREMHPKFAHQPGVSLSVAAGSHICTYTSSRSTTVDR